jgi:adenylate cyclase
MRDGFWPRRLLIGLALGLAATGLAWIAAASAPARDLEDSTYDWRVRHTTRPADARPDIALVLINESSLRALEPMFGAWPWPRFLHAGVIDFLARAGARVIAYDVLFTDHDRRTQFTAAGRTLSGEESDAELAAAVKRAGNVVVLADAVFEGLEHASSSLAADAPLNLPGPQYRPGGSPIARPVRLPIGPVAAAAAGVGHNYAVRESHDATRRMQPFVQSQDLAVPSLGLAAALTAEHLDPKEIRFEGSELRIGARRMPLVDGQALLNFHGPFATLDGRNTYQPYSFFDVLLSEDNLANRQPPAIDPAVFRDKIVFVGTSASGLGDVWRTPFRAGGMPGIQLHAALADDVLSGRFMRRATAGADLGLTAAAGLIAGVVAALLPVGWAAGVVAALGFALFLGLTKALGHGLWLAAVAPLAAMALALFEGVAWQYFVEGRAKREIKRLFGRYVSKDVFDQLVADPSLARLGGQRREMTVLFSDIRGFTAASERGAPEEIVHQLNEYFTAMVGVLFKYRGTLDKFVGDMVMGLFGAPMDDPAHADHAVAAAREMTLVLDRLNAAWTAAGKPPLDIGIGINSGEMIAGNIGSDTIMSYTVIGDAVNLGARLESLNKEYGTRILISEATRSRLTQPVTTRRIGDVTVKGRTQPVTVYEVKP